MSTPTKFYVVEHEYIGPNKYESHDDKWINYDHCEIVDEPALDTNGEPKIKGSCGTKHDVNIFAWGEFDTEQEAEAYIVGHIGYFKTEDGYKAHEYPLMSVDSTREWLNLDESDITGSTTNVELEKMLDNWNMEANGNGYALGYV